MARIEIELRRSYSSNFKDIRDLLLELKKIENVTRNDDVFVYLPAYSKHTISELALGIIWTRLRAFMGSPCGEQRLIYNRGSRKDFDQAHFFDQLTGKRSKLPWSAARPLHFESFLLADDENDIASKIASGMKSTLPKTERTNEAKISILELVSNAFNHSKSPSEVGTISKYTEKTNNFTFCIADTGDGVRESFLRNEHIREKFIQLSESDLLLEATNQDITCNPQSSPQYNHGNSGMGWYFLRELCKAHGGSLTIISGRGYVQFEAGGVKLKRLPIVWKGTIVAFHLNLLGPIDDHYSSLRDEFIRPLLDAEYNFQ